MIFAEIAIWGRRMTNEEPQRRAGRDFVDLSASYLPTLKVVAICCAVAAGTWWARGLSINVESTMHQVTALSKSISEGQTKATEEQLKLMVEIEKLKDKFEEADNEFRLFKDFTEGRIGSMPYRPSQPERRPQ
jgi:hypothetical protein